MTFQRYTSLVCGLLCLSVLLSSGCEDEASPATALVVSVTSDLEDLDQVEVRVFSRDADPSTDTPDDAQTETVPASIGDALSIVVKQGKSTQVMLAILGLDRRGHRLVEIRRRASFTKGKTMAVPVFLGKSCLDVFCETKKLQTCVAERTDDVEAGTCAAIPPLSESGQFPVIKPGDEHKNDHMTDVPEDRMDGGDGSTDADAEPAETGVDTGVDASDGSTDADAAPCSKPMLTSATCGLSPQCGCAMGQACRLQGAQATGCLPPGPQPSQTACASNGDCAAGLGCIGSRCTPYCQVDADCGPNGVCANINNDGTPIPGANACFVACTASSGMPCGQGLACAHFASSPIGGRTVNGDFCIKPAAPCGSVNNGICDESKGTRLCADGTDSADCTVEPACSASMACPSGSVCGGGLCRRICTTDAQCGTGTKCSTNANVTTQFCFSTCNPATPSVGCPSGAICSAGGTCVRPQTPCPYQDDKACDEPSGTRWCGAGTDAVDCAPATCASSSPNGPCDLVSQCGCSKEQACLFTSVATTGAVSGACGTSGSVASAAACSATAPCGKGYLCFKSTCRRFCRGNSDCTAPTTCSGLTYTLDGDAGVVNLQQLGACLP